MLGTGPYRAESKPPAKPVVLICVLNYAIEENTFLKFRKKIEKKAAVETFLVFLK